MICSKISLRIKNPHQKENVNYLMKHSSFQREGQSSITSRITEGHHETIWYQMISVLKKWEPCMYAYPYHQLHSLTIRLLTTPSHPGWDAQFWNHWPTLVPFAWQRNKAILLCFTQNSISKIQFGTGIQRVIFGINPYPEFLGFWTELYYCLPCSSGLQTLAELCHHWLSWVSS